MVRFCTGLCESTAKFEQHPHVGPSTIYRTPTISFPDKSSISQSRRSQYSPSAQTAAAAAAAAAAAPGSQTVSSSSSPTR